MTIQLKDKAKSQDTKIKPKQDGESGCSAKAELFFMGPARKLTPSSSVSSIDDATTAANESLGLVVNEWDYRCANLVYVVLSRVRTRLFLTKPLDLDREFNVPQSFIDFGNRIRTNLEQPTLDKLAQKGHYRTGGTRDAE